MDIHREGRSQRSAPQKRHTAHLRSHAGCTPRKLSRWEGGGDKLQPSTGGDCARQAPGHLSCSDQGRVQNIVRLCEVPENRNLSGLDLGSAHNPALASDSSWQSKLELKQCRQEKHKLHEWGQTQCAQDTVSTHQCYLFTASLPSHSTTEQVT